MTGEVGYCPTRVHALSRATHHAADELARLSSTDPAANDALRVVALAAHNLRESWIPLLRRIEATDVMRAWTPSGHLLGIDHRSWHVLPANRFHELADDTLIETLRQLAGAIRLDLTGDPLDDQLTGPDHAALVAALVARLDRSPRFRTDLMEAIGRAPQSAWLLTGDDIAADVRADALASVLTGVWRQPGHGWDRIAAVADSLLAGLVDEPALALDVLDQESLLRTLADWPDLDQVGVAEFVHAGLTTAVADDPALHRRGIAVLEALTLLANDPLIDHRGFQPGLSIGVTSSIGTYVPSFIDTIRIKSGTVAARSDGVDGRFDVTLGTYEEMTDLFGALMRNSEGARAHLGVELSALTRLAVEAPNGLPGSIRVDTVAEFAELIRDSADNEVAERSIAAAARRAALLDTATLFGLSASAVFLVARGAGPVARFLFEQVVDDVVELAADRDTPNRRGGPDFTRATHNMVVTSAARRLVADPELRRTRGVEDGAGCGQVRSILDQLDALARLESDPEEVDRLLYDLESSVRSIGGDTYLDELLHRPAVHDLTTSPTPPD